MACTAALGGVNSILTELTSFFLYDDNGKFVLLPWDTNDAFTADETENGIDRFYLDFWGESEPSDLFDLLMSDPENREIYHGYIRKINEQFLAPETIDPLFQQIVSRIKPYLSRDHTMYFNKPYDLPVAPEEGFGTLGSLLMTIHRFHDSLEEQLNGSADRFYANPADNDFPPLEEFDRLIGYLVQNSPLLDPDITKKICVGYSDYCRSRGITHFATGDPAEYVAAAVLFVLVFVLVLLCIWRPHRRVGLRKKRNVPENRRC